jgi:hypothetical protein
MKKITSQQWENIARAAVFIIWLSLILFLLINS